MKRERRERADDEAYIRAEKIDEKEINEKREREGKRTKKNENAKVSAVYPARLSPS